MSLALGLASLSHGESLATSSPLRFTAVTVTANASCCDSGVDSESLENPLGLPDGTMFAEASAGGCYGCMGMSCLAWASISLGIHGDSLSLDAELLANCWASADVSATVTTTIDRPYWMSWQPAWGAWSTSIGGDFPLRIEPGTHTVHLQAWPCGWHCPASGVLSFSRVYPLDIHPDGTVDAVDLAEILGHWGRCDPARTAADVNLDGAVNATDLALVLTGWGTDGRGP